MVDFYSFIYSNRNSAYCVAKVDIFVDMCNRGVFFFVCDIGEGCLLTDGGAVLT